MITVINKIPKPPKQKSPASRGQFFSLHLDPIGEKAEKLEAYIKTIETKNSSVTVTIYKEFKELRYNIETDTPGLSKQIRDIIKEKFP